MMTKISICTLLILVLIFVACGRMDDAAHNMADAVPMLEAASPASTPPPPLVAESIPAPALGDSALRTQQTVAADDLAPAVIAADSPAEDANFEPVDAAPELTLGEPVAPRMIIRSADMGLSTYDFEGTITSIERIMTNRGGFIENSHQWMEPAAHDNALLLWRAEFVLRVPVGLFDQVNRELVALAQVQRFSTISEDVTLEFNDLGSRLRIREEELRRVELMLEAAENLTDIINLEAQVTTLRLAVDAYQRRMTEIDQLASFSTIRMAMYEVVEIEELEAEEEEVYYPIAYYDDTFGTRFTRAFSASVDFITAIFTNIAVFLAWVGLPAILIAGVVIILYKILKKTGLVRIKFRT